MKIPKCKGMRDLNPGEMDAFCQVEGTFRDSCLKWGYREVRTPTLEYLHLFTSAGTLTPSMLGRVYSFLDWDGWSGERVVLKPDGTIPVARYYIDSAKAKELARLFYVTNIFVFEETGKKSRERWQCGTELIGAGSPLADTELILLSLEVLNNLKIAGVELRLSHAGLIKTLLAEIEPDEQERARIFDRILDGDGATLARARTKNPELEEMLRSLMNLKGNSSGFLRNLKALSGSIRGAGEHIDNFVNVVENLEAVGCDFKIDIASGAGFEYYTGVIFQLFCGAEKIGGGGRYDDLIPAMGGKDIPACGFALYTDRLMSRIKAAEAGVVSKRVLVKADTKRRSGLKDALALAGKLREAGYAAQLDLDSGEQTGFKWLVEVGTAKSGYTLTDLEVSRISKASTLQRLLTLLGEQSGD